MSYCCSFYLFPGPEKVFRYVGILLANFGSLLRFLFKTFMICIQILFVFNKLKSSEGLSDFKMCLYLSLMSSKLERNIVLNDMQFPERK